MKNMKSTKRALLVSVMSLFVCFTMLIGTTYAWFTDSVTSAGNIIASGTLNVEMYYANATEAPDAANWKDASTGTIFNYNKWEPGYVEARHIQVKNTGSLALAYQLRIVANGTVSKLADVIDVYYFENATQLTRANVENGEWLGSLADIMGTDKNLTKTVKGVLVPAEEETNSLKSEKTITLAFKMRETAGNEYQNLSIGSSFAVELTATQTSFEADGIGTDYDAESVVPSPEVPAALVRPLENLTINTDGKLGWGINLADYGKTTLDTGYKFEPTMSLEKAQNSEYRYWHADFMIYADKDVAAESLAIAGYYDAWCQYNDDAWVALPSDDRAAGVENGLRLVQLLGDGSITVCWDDLCEFGNDGIGFQCGAVALDDSVAGTTLTVELRMYETACDDPGCHHDKYACETGKYITVGEFKYTFPKTVDSEAGLADALASGGTVTLATGEYKMPSSSSTSDLTIVGTEDTVVDVTRGAYMENANVTFKGVTIKTSTGMVNGNGSDYAALYTPNVTYIDCTFEGPMRVGRDGAKFINCTFNSLGNDYVWTYGNDVTFEGCTFNTDGKAILIYSDGGNEVAEVTVKNCTFNSTKGAKAGAITNQNCAAIEIHNYGNGVDLVTEGNTYDANFSGEWRIKTYESGRTQIFVNDVEYTQTALDGTLLTVVGGQVQ